jgi:hypothetical protein
VSAPRKHHYIPQFYLRHFSSGDGQICQIEKGSGKSIRTGIGNVAAIRDYHTIDEESAPDQFQIERNLSRVEDVLSSALRRVITEGIVDAEVKARMVELVSLLRMRVPAVKRCIERLMEDVVRSVGTGLERQGKFPPPPKGFENDLLMEKVRIEIKNWACLDHMFNLAFDEEILGILFNMNATIIDACEGCGFLTCDQPVAMFNPKTLPTDPYGTPLVDVDTELSIPLSQKALLLLAWKPGSERRTGDLAEVAEFNRRTIIMASNYIFSSEIASAVQDLVRENSRYFAGIETPQVLDYGKGALHLMRVKAVMPREAYRP